MPDPVYLDHEKLDVYKLSVSFTAWLSSLLDNAPKLGDVKDQLDRASTSIPLNIAEGNGKYTTNPTPIAHRFSKLPKHHKLIHTNLKTPPAIP